MKRHEYVITDLNPEHPAVARNNLAVGSKLILPWRGKTHPMETEHNGKITYLCTVTHVREHEEPTGREAT